VKAEKLSYLRTGELEKTLFERMCMTQRLKGLVSTCDMIGHRLKPFVDQLGDYLNLTIKGTVFEHLTAVDMWDVSQGEECWLEQDVLQCLSDLFVCKGKVSDAGSSWVSGGHAQPHPKARQYNKFTQRSGIFSPSSFSVRDSHVVICKGNWYAGRIKQIFAYPSGLPSELEAYFVI
jgi:hypothetical protein